MVRQQWRHLSLCHLHHTTFRFELVHCLLCSKPTLATQSSTKDNWGLFDKTCQLNLKSNYVLLWNYRKQRPHASQAAWFHQVESGSGALPKWRNNNQSQHLPHRTEQKATGTLWQNLSTESKVHLPYISHEIRKPRPPATNLGSMPSCCKHHRDTLCINLCTRIKSHRDQKSACPFVFHDVEGVTTQAMSSTSEGSLGVDRSCLVYQLVDVRGMRFGKQGSPKGPKYFSTWQIFDKKCKQNMKSSSRTTDTSHISLILSCKTSDPPFFRPLLHPPHRDPGHVNESKALVVQDTATVLLFENSVVRHHWTWLDIGLTDNRQ